MSALEGLRIVDFSRFLPGAYASWVAADMGAEVIRFEHPREVAKQAEIFETHGDSAAVARNRARPSYARGKRSLLINPGNAAARPVLEQLIARADVLIEDYRPGMLSAMGYGPEAMLELNPRLIYVSVSFAGQFGPYAGKGGHDPAALALAGALSRLNGTSAPTLPGMQIADPLTGAHATIAMLLALQARERTGKGQHVDVAMSDASLALQLVWTGRYDDLDDLPAPGEWQPRGAVWECADGGFICTTDLEPRYWARFCEVVGRPEYIALQHDRESYPAMHEDLAALFLTKTRDEWHALLSEADTQVMPVFSLEEALEHPHNRARGRVFEAEVPGQEPVRQLALPFILAETQPVPPRPAGLPGADNAAILAELGLSEAELDKAGAFSPEKRS
jgi:crotonobetainyl-CoA:carnitine CoA-transferase CaiB-like acyl-CoA transferase